MQEVHTTGYGCQKGFFLEHLLNLCGCLCHSLINAEKNLCPVQTQLVATVWVHHITFWLMVKVQNWTQSATFTKKFLFKISSFSCNPILSSSNLKYQYSQVLRYKTLILIKQSNVFFLFEAKYYLFKGNRGNSSIHITTTHTMAWWDTDQLKPFE